jgi:hypothetical protein
MRLVRARSSPKVAGERLELPALEEREHDPAPVRGAAPRRARDGARQQGLGPLDDPERREVPDLLHLGQPVDAAVAHVGVTDHGPHPAVGEGLHEVDDGVGVEVGVGVDEHEDLACRPPDPLRHGAPLAVVAPERHRVQLWPALLGLLDPLPGAVRRPVVDGDHLEAAGRVVHGEARGDRPDDPVLLVERGDDDRHRGAKAAVGHGPVEQRHDEAPEDVQDDGDGVGREQRVAGQRGEGQVLGEPDEPEDDGGVGDDGELEGAAQHGASGGEGPLSRRTGGRACDVGFAGRRARGQGARSVRRQDDDPPP